MTAPSPDTTELVALRDLEQRGKWMGSMPADDVGRIAGKAADRIQALTSQITQLTEALSPFAAVANDMFVDPENGWSDDDVLSIEADPDFGAFARLKAGDFRRARAALAHLSNSEKPE